MMYIVCIIVIIFLNNSIGIYFKNVCFLNFKIVFKIKIVIYDNKCIILYLLNK